MLRNGPITQKESDLPRQWSSDDYFDLIVWYEADASIYGFQLCYDKYGEERAVTWTKNTAAAVHHLVDNGEPSALSNMTPVLTKLAHFDAPPVIERFLERSALLKPSVRDLVLDKLRRLA